MERETKRLKLVAPEAKNRLRGIFVKTLDIIFRCFTIGCSNFLLYGILNCLLINFQVYLLFIYIKKTGKSNITTIKTISI